MVFVFSTAPLVSPRQTSWFLSGGICRNRSAAFTTCARCLSVRETHVHPHIHSDVRRHHHHHHHLLLHQYLFKKIVVNRCCCQYKDWPFFIIRVSSEYLSLQVRPLDLQHAWRQWQRWTMRLPWNPWIILTTLGRLGPLKSFFKNVFLPWTSPFYVGCSFFAVFSIWNRNKQTNKRTNERTNEPTKKQTNKQTNKQTTTNRFKPTLKLVKFQGESWSDWLLPRVIWLQESLGGLQLGPPSCVSNTRAFPAYLYMLSQIGIVYYIICLQTIIVQLPLGMAYFHGHETKPQESSKVPGLRFEIRGSVCVWVCVCVYIRKTQRHIYDTILYVYHHFMI